MAAPSPGWRSQQDIPLPRAIDPNKFASAREPEVLAITEALKKSELGTRYGVDGIPRHLRRRTRSHNPYKHRRRPNAVKEALLQKQMEAVPESNSAAATASTTHPPFTNRKMRRRPAKLAADCLSKASWSESEIENLKIINEIEWDALESDESLPPIEPPPPPPPPRRLETHLWHAKRLTMAPTWTGWVLPEGESGRGRGTRAFTRRISTGAVMHDASYWCPVLLSGSLTAVTACLNHVMDPEIVESVSKHLESRGSRTIGCEIEAMLHKIDLFPLAALVPVRLLALPLRNKERVKICIWIHGAGIKEAFDSFKAAVAIIENKAETSDTTAAMEVEGEATTNSRLSLSVGDARRIEIRGSKSDQVLLNALFSHTKGTEDSTKQCLPQKLSSLRPSQAAVIALADPRCTKPITLGSSTCTHLLDPNSSNKVDFDVFSHNYPPPLTEAAISQARKKARLDELSVGAGRETTTTLENDLGGATHCGAIFIRGYKASKSSTGWSIILPPGWVMPIWVALAFQGCRAAGQREWRWLHTLDHRAFFPNDTPDSSLSVRYRRERIDKLETESAKRPIGKIGKLCPFEKDWEVVLSSDEIKHQWRKKPYVARTESSMLQSLFEFSLSDQSPELAEVTSTTPRRLCGGGGGAGVGTSLRPVAKALAAKKLQWVPRTLTKREDNICLVETAVTILNQGAIDEDAEIYVVRNEEAHFSQAQPCYVYHKHTRYKHTPGDEGDKRLIEMSNLACIGHITSSAPQATGRGIASFGLVGAAAFWRLRSLQFSEYRRDGGTVKAWLRNTGSPIIYPVRLSLLVEKK